jgi:hypothetical protein
MSYGTHITLDTPFADTVACVRAAAGGTVGEALDPQVMVTLSGCA